MLKNKSMNQEMSILTSEDFKPKAEDIEREVKLIAEFHRDEIIR